jgi:hypothetical protein
MTCKSMECDPKQTLFCDLMDTSSRAKSWYLKKKKGNKFCQCYMSIVAKIVGYHFTTPNCPSISNVISTCWYHKLQQNANP